MPIKKESKILCCCILLLWWNIKTLAKTLVLFLSSALPGAVRVLCFCWDGVKKGSKVSIFVCENNGDKIEEREREQKNTIGSTCTLGNYLIFDALPSFNFNIHCTKSTHTHTNTFNEFSMYLALFTFSSFYSCFTINFSLFKCRPFNLMANTCEARIQWKKNAFALRCFELHENSANKKLQSGGKIIGHCLVWQQQSVSIWIEPNNRRRKIWCVKVRWIR